MLGDNKTSFILIMDPKSQNQIKHIDVMYHHVSELVEDRKLAIHWILNFNILADGLIKALFIEPFKRH